MRHYFDNTFILTEEEKKAYVKKIALEKYQDAVQEAKELKELYLACKKKVALNGDTDKANAESVKYLRAEAIRVWNEAEELLKHYNEL